MTPDHEHNQDEPIVDPPTNLVDQLLGSSSALQALGQELVLTTTSAISLASLARFTTHTVCLFQLQVLHYHSVSPYSCPGDLGCR